jgi:hypothetical protein
MDGHHQAALDALVLMFGLPPLLAWGGSALALVGRPSGGKAVLGLGSCVVAALTSALFAHGFQLDPTVAKVLILGATLVFVVAHIRRYRSTRRAPTSATSSYETVRSQLRRVWRYL